MPPRSWGRQTKPLIIAHRGASALATENTLAAFRRAREDGADGVELDVLRCRSGEVVVFHDDDLSRLAGRPERVEELDLQQVRRISLRPDGSIPLLGEVFDELGDGMLVNVELKSGKLPDLKLARAVAELLRARRVGPRILVSSFHPVLLGAFRAFAPDVATGLLFHAEQRRPLREAWPRLAIRPSALHPEKILVDEGHLKKWRAEGYAVNVWTVDDEAEIVRLSALGVDGIITNDPARTRAIVERGAPPSISI
jgi:glycerophosphoryl diester phosphodiesterase